MLDTYYGLGGEVSGPEALADALECPFCGSDLPDAGECPGCAEAVRREMLATARVLPQEDGR